MPSRRTGPACSRRTGWSPARRRRWRRRCRRSTKARASLPPACDHRHDHLGQRCHLDLRGQQHQGGAGSDGERQYPAERETHQHVEPRRAQILDGPVLLDGAGGEEEHLVGRHRRTEQRDRVIPVGGRGLGVGDRWATPPGARAPTSPGAAGTRRRRRRSDSARADR